MATTKIISDVTVDGAVKVIPLNGSKALASSSDGTVVESTTTSTELGYVHGVTAGIQGQIDAVAQSAARGLKLVDLTTYSGSTDGEIVRHNGATTEHYINGWDYKFQVIPSEYPSGVLAVRLNGAIANQSGNPVDAASLITTDRNYIKTTATPYLVGNSTTWLQLSSSSVPAVGDGILFESGSSFKYGVIEEIEETSTRYNISFSCDGRTGLNDYLTKSDNQTTKYTFANNSGQTIVSRYAYINEASYIANASTTEDALYFVVSDGKAYPILIEEDWMGSSSLLPAQSGWVQWDSQPSSVAEVSDLKTRMTAAETAISGKQNALTFDDAPMAGSNNVVKSGGVDTAIKNSQRVFYAVTETAGATAVKEFTIPNFPTELVNGVKTPLKGTILIAQCANTDTRTAQLKFKVNDGGEFPIWYSTAEKTNTTVDLAIFGNTYRRYAYAFNGTHWCWVSNGDDVNTTYTAGTGLKLSSNQFSLNVPRVAKTANSLPGENTAIIEEYSAGSNYNLPSNHYYHIITMVGNNTIHATQLALGMSTDAAYYRKYYNSVWGSWLRLDNPTMDSTPTAGNTANVVSSAGTKTYVDEQVATKSSITIRQWVTE